MSVANRKREREQLLFDLRGLRNQGRKDNKEAVVQEYTGEKQRKAGGHAQYVRERKAMEVEAETEARSTAISVMEEEKMKLRNTSAIEAAKKKRKTVQSAVADMKSTEQQYRTYERRTKSLKKGAQERYEKAKQQLGDKIYIGADDLAYGEAPKPSKEDLEGVVNELKAFEAKKSTFSRRRADYAEKDITYINARNKNFNKNLERSFGKFTNEIRQNLERGSAL